MKASWDFGFGLPLCVVHFSVDGGCSSDRYLTDGGWTTKSLERMGRSGSQCVTRNVSRLEGHADPFHHSEVRGRATVTSLG
jgi:hypothetical protein